VTYVKQILKTKGSDLWTIAKDKTVSDALQLLAAKDIGALLVMDHDKLVGIFSERDYARKVFLLGKSPDQTLVKEIMTNKVFYVSPDDTVEGCMALMTHQHIHHLAVMENDKLVGMISIGDVVKAMIMAREFAIKQLERYITGSGR